MSKRIISLSVSIVLLLAGTVGRVGYIIFSKDYTASTSYNHYSLNIDKKYPTIYYSNGVKATNNKPNYIAVIRPNQKCISELNKLFDSKETRSIIEELKKGYPLLKRLDAKPSVKLKYINVYTSFSDDNNLKQLIAKESNGILNHIGSTIGEKNVIFAIDAQGRLLDGDEGKIENINYNSPEGYRISINRQIQQIALDASEDLTSGCVLVLDVKDSSILALVNKPDETYMIKPFNKYAVGSVFKLVVAACALENGIDPQYNCTGSIKIGDSVFSCQNKHIHKSQNLKQALANSCNCYFVNLANELGRDNLLATAEKLGFGDVTQIFDKWDVKNANLPSYDDLASTGELSLFGFGQGKLSVTPLQMGAFLCTVANNGVKNVPRLFLENINNENEKTEINYQPSEKVLSDYVCEALLEYMHYVVTDGTGKNAQSSSKKSAGKTATAQTGQYFMTNEYLNTWFAGVYPYDEPEYAVVVMKEHGKSGSLDCCPIFRTIVEQLQNI